MPNAVFGDLHIPISDTELNYIMRHAKEVDFSTPCTCASGLGDTKRISIYRGDYVLSYAMADGKPKPVRIEKIKNLVVTAGLKGTIVTLYTKNDIIQHRRDRHIIICKDCYGQKSF